MTRMMDTRRFFTIGISLVFGLCASHILQCDSSGRIIMACIVSDITPNSLNHYRNRAHSCVQDRDQTICYHQDHA